MKKLFVSNHLWIKFLHMNTLKKVLPIILATLWFGSFLPAQGQGVVEGRVLNGTQPGAPLKGVSIEVVGLAGGMNVLKSAAPDSSGRFRLEGLPTDSMLLIRAVYGSVFYYSPLQFDNAAKANVEIQVFEPTDSMQGIRLEDAQIAFKLTDAGLGALESYSLANESKPPRSFMRADGNFRFSKAAGLAELPRLSITGPGSNMPVPEAPLESADGQSYYSRYPLRPGTTTIEISQAFPYQKGTYTYKKKFFQDVSKVNIGVIPQDMNVSGEGLTKVQVNAAQNFAVYSTGPIKAGTEVAWTFSGGTPVAEASAAPETAAPEQQPSILPMPTPVGQNAIFIGSLLLLGFLLILWYAGRRIIPAAGSDAEVRIRELKERREHLLNQVAVLDARYENVQGPERREYLKMREHSKRHLRRIGVLLGKSGNPKGNL
jgi:hypothetical protein